MSPLGIRTLLLGQDLGTDTPKKTSKIQSKQVWKNPPLGLGLGSIYASQHGKEAWIAIALPIFTFLLLAGINHLVEIIRDKNYAPNNTMILIWDFGMPISIAALLISSNTI